MEILVLRLLQTLNQFFIVLKYSGFLAKFFVKLKLALETFLRQPIYAMEKNNIVLFVRTTENICSNTKIIFCDINTPLINNML